MRSLTKNEYLDRLENLIPKCCIEKRLVVCSETVSGAAEMVESLAAELHDTFDDMVETDLVVEVKNATRDLFTLGRFLDISFQTILTDGT